MIKKLRYLCTLLLIAVASAAWADDVLVYTLDGTQTGGSNGYATESEITQNDITWMVMGNTTMSPWRIGGKNLTNEDRPLYSTSSPLLIYECHIGMAQDAEKVGTYTEFKDNVLPRVAKAGYNAIQIMAIQEYR